MACGNAFALLGGAFGCTFLALLFWLAVDQHRVVEGSQRLLDHTVPATLERFRLARNVEHLRLEGEHVFSGRTPVARQQALFIVSLPASHPAVLADSRAAGLAGEVEHFLGRAAREGTSDPRYTEWATLSNGLSLLADNVSIEAVNLATADLHGMSATILQSRSKLLLVLAQVAVVVGSLVFLIHRHLIQPLQAIDQALSALGSGEAAAPFAAPSMLEIRAVEGATGQLGEMMQENEKTREQLESLAATDGLTGMFRRRHFVAVAEEEIRRAQRYSRPICVGLADASPCPLYMALQRGDAALCDAKQQGRKRVVTAPVGDATESAGRPSN